ncbi:transcriptional regulator [Asticcacaulis sp. BYS171W]|uniref:Transcriptional regulator n=1 Tax=Asticcacaulis aquaticus TaxID=2984212 RepID=A0ABT5HXA5_9CAUL|nr:transcriptional regulator [Asticcacaulis aquaticus]MDC7684707.1 transcriptional regulator [Asticcacaulis aquaticus]
MVDLTREMADLMSALGRPQSERGRALMFVSSYAGEGVSTVAREYARIDAAYAKRPVWLIDADLRRQGQLDAVLEEPARFGPPGPVSAATPDGSVFFALSPKGKDAEGNPVPDSKYLIARPFFDKRLWVTRLRDHLLMPGQRVKLFEQSSYWQSLRQHAQSIIVDVPSAERANAAVQLAPLMDGVIIVISEGEGEINARLALKDEIEQAGGRILGMVYNKARSVARPSQRPASRSAV